MGEGSICLLLITSIKKAHWNVTIDKQRKLQQQKNMMILLIKKKHYFLDFKESIDG